MVCFSLIRLSYARILCIQIWFFDNYIIPLAQKLDKCGVFGVSYQEYATYAEANKEEWKEKGKEIVEAMKAHCDEKYKELLKAKLRSTQDHQIQETTP